MSELAYCWYNLLYLWISSIKFVTGVKIKSTDKSKLDTKQQKVHLYLYIHLLDNHMMPYCYAFSSHVV